MADVNGNMEKLKGLIFDQVKRINDNKLMPIDLKNGLTIPFKQLMVQFREAGGEESEVPDAVKIMNLLR